MFKLKIQYNQGSWYELQIISEAAILVDESIKLHTTPLSRVRVRIVRQPMTSTPDIIMIDQLISVPVQITG